MQKRATPQNQPFRLLCFYVVEVLVLSLARDTDEPADPPIAKGIVSELYVVYKVLMLVVQVEVRAGRTPAFVVLALGVIGFRHHPNRRVARRSSAVMKGKGKLKKIISK